LEAHTASGEAVTDTEMTLDAVLNAEAWARAYARELYATKMPS